MARYLGVKVEVFSIGFGKKILSKTHNGTEYCLSLIPLGGYVQMKGQDDSNPSKTSSDFDSYNVKTPFEKILISIAGPAFNFLLAFFIYLFVAYAGWMKLAPTIGAVMETSNAYEKIKVGDKIVEINGIKIREWNEIKPIVDNSNSLTILFNRDGKLLQTSITPKILETKNIFGETIQKKLIGISPNGEKIIIHYEFFEGIKVAFNELIEKSKLIFQSIQKLITGVIGTENLSGPITIVKVTSDMSDYGIIPLLLLTALISVNLGVLNLLPIPALDGGHIMFNTYELITKKAVSENVMLNMTIAGWVILFGLMILGTYNDINRLISG
jgi:regulator of sigma E protease